MKKNNISVHERVRGAILGAMIGDALGSRYAFMKAESLTKVSLECAWVPWRISDETQSMVALMEGISRFGMNFEEIRKSYVRWANSAPEDIDIVSSRAFMMTESTFESKFDAEKILENERICSNLLLARQIPWTLTGKDWDPMTLRHCIDWDSRLSHNDDLCSEMAQVYSIALLSALRGESKNEIWHQIFAHTRSKIVHTLLLESYFRAPICDGKNYSDIRTSLASALYHFWRSDHFVSSIRGIILRGGACDTNACALGALLGAHFGFSNIPKPWIQGLMRNPANYLGEYGVKRALYLTDKLLYAPPQESLESMAA